MSDTRGGALRRNPNATLLAVQLLSILIFPFLDGDASALGRSLFSLLGLLVLVLAIRALNATPMFTWVGIVLLILTVADGVLGWTQPLHVWSDVLHILFYGYTTISLIVYMFRDDKVTNDEVFAVGAWFTVAVWTFAYAYSIIGLLSPGAFAAATPGPDRTWIELLFLSCTTMTSTGLSDVVPVCPARPLGRDDPADRRHVVRGDGGRPTGRDGPTPPRALRQRLTRGRETRPRGPGSRGRVSRMRVS